MGQLQCTAPCFKPLSSHPQCTSGAHKTTERGFAGSPQPTWAGITPQFAMCSAEESHQPPASARSHQELLGNAREAPLPPTAPSPPVPEAHWALNRICTMLWAGKVLFKPFTGVVRVPNVSWGIPTFRNSPRARYLIKRKKIPVKFDVYLLFTMSNDILSNSPLNFIMKYFYNKLFIGAFISVSGNTLL